MKKFTGDLFLCLGCVYVLAAAYSLLSGPITPAPGGYAICYRTAIVFAPENCASYAGPGIKIPDDL